jgi:hypothetical protein
MPVDFFNLLHIWLDLDATARLYATFDRRMQYLLAVSRIRRTAEVSASSDGQHWHIVYYLKSLNDFDTVHLARHAHVTLKGLRELSALQPKYLTLDTHSICILTEKRDPFSYSSQRHKLLGPQASTSRKDLDAHPVMLYLKTYFPHVQVLTILTPIVSILSVPKGTPSPIALEGDFLMQFATYLPQALQTLHCANFSIDSRISLRNIWSQLPKTLTDVRMTTKCSSDHLTLYDFLGPLPALRTLRITLSANGPVRWARFPSTSKFPTSLTDLEISVHSTDLVPDTIKSCFPWVQSNLSRLSLVGEPAVPKTERSATDLKPLMPQGLLEFHITESLTRHVSRKLIISSLPSSVVSLYMGSAYIDTDILGLICYMPSLQLFSICPTTRPAQLPDWRFLPRTLNALELKGYTLSGPEIEVLPASLTRLQCHVELLEDVSNILTRCPKVNFFCDRDIYLSNLNMAQVLYFGLDLVECVTSFTLLEYLYRFCGSRCTINFSFARSLSRLMQTESLTLAPNNKALILESHSAHMRSLSLSSATFEMSLVKNLQHLQLLEYQSRQEISSLKFCPPNLTSLNLRRSPIKAGITLRDMPKSLTVLIAHFESTLLLTADNLPRTRQLKVLDTPSLVYGGDDIVEGCSDDVQVVRAKVSWMYDNGVQLLLDRWKSAISVELSVVVKPTGHLHDMSRNIMTLATLEEDTRCKLTTNGLITKVDVIPPLLLWVPPHITQLNLLWTGNVPPSLSGFENEKLPETLTHLEIHLARGVRDLFAKLPPHLTYLHLDSTYSSMDYTGPFPASLQTLICQSRKGMDRSKTLPYVPFLLHTLPQKLNRIQFINCQLEWHRYSPESQQPHLGIKEVLMDSPSLTHLAILKYWAPDADVLDTANKN